MTVRLKNCVVLNRSTVPIKKAGIRYVFQGGAYLNFTDMDCPRGFSSCQFEGFDRNVDEVRFKGPLTIKELNNQRFFNFPREISSPNPEYTVDSMNTKETKTKQKGGSFNFHLDPNRIRTDAEIKLFANVFSLPLSTARQILTRSASHNFNTAKRNPPSLLCAHNTRTQT